MTTENLLIEQIWKFELHNFEDCPDGITDISMPVDAVVLSVGMQGMRLVIWAKVKFVGMPNRETRRFRYFGTGHGLCFSSRLEYIGTVQFEFYQNKNFVVHVFEEKTEQ